MLLNFERGSQAKPKGHAIAYLRNVANPDEVYATYLIVPPISIDLTKYMPPMFAGKFSLAELETVSAIPLPPVPEKVPGLAWLRQLAESREDDIIALGVSDVRDPQTMLGVTTEAAQEYLRSYQAAIGAQPKPVAEELPAASDDTVQDVLYELMSDRDKLSEVAKLLGKLRYAIDSGDAPLAADATAEVEAVAKHLPAKYHTAEAIAAAKRPGEKGRRLLELHLARCYKLCDEDYRAVEALEAQIREAEAQTQG
jgi:hypothetical protein